MPPSGKEFVLAVVYGRTPGLYTLWSAADGTGAEDQVKGRKKVDGGGLCKRFSTEALALDFWRKIHGAQAQDPPRIRSTPLTAATFQSWGGGSSVNTGDRSPTAPSNFRSRNSESRVGGSRTRATRGQNSHEGENLDWKTFAQFPDRSSPSSEGVKREFGKTHSLTSNEHAEDRVKLWEAEGDKRDLEYAVRFHKGERDTYKQSTKQHESEITDLRGKIRQLKNDKLEAASVSAREWGKFLSLESENELFMSDALNKDALITNLRGKVQELRDEKYEAASSSKEEWGKLQKEAEGLRLLRDVVGTPQELEATKGKALATLDHALATTAATKKKLGVGLPEHLEGYLKRQQRALQETKRRVVQAKSKDDLTQIFSSHVQAQVYLEQSAFASLLEDTVNAEKRSGRILSDCQKELAKAISARGVLKLELQKRGGEVSLVQRKLESKEKEARGEVAKLTRAFAVEKEEWGKKLEEIEGDNASLTKAVSQSHWNSPDERPGYVGGQYFDSEGHHQPEVELEHDRLDARDRDFEHTLQEEREYCIALEEEDAHIEQQNQLREEEQHREQQLHLQEELARDEALNKELDEAVRNAYGTPPISPTSSSSPSSPSPPPPGPGQRRLAKGADTSGLTPAEVQASQKASLDYWTTVRKRGGAPTGKPKSTQKLRKEKERAFREQTTRTKVVLADGREGQLWQKEGFADRVEFPNGKVSQLAAHLKRIPTSPTARRRAGKKSPEVAVVKVRRAPGTPGSATLPVDLSARKKAKRSEEVAAVKPKTKPKTKRAPRVKPPPSTTPPTNQDGEEIPLEECPLCVPGSGKPLRHRGPHRTTKKP